MTIIVHPALLVLVVAAALAWRFVPRPPQASAAPSLRPVTRARTKKAKRVRYAQPRDLTEGRFVTRNGYVTVHAPGHPLARKNGYMMEHRKVLFDAIGGGEHPCRWCGDGVTWEATWADGSKRYLMVDHIDGDRQNNSIDNLAVACNDCNSVRTAPMEPVDDDDLEPKPKRTPVYDFLPGESEDDRRRRLNRERQQRHRDRKRAQSDLGA